jgi:hypothetical protein
VKGKVSPGGLIHWADLVSVDGAGAPVDGMLTKLK